MLLAHSELTVVFFAYNCMLSVRAEGNHEISLLRYHPVNKNICVSLCTCVRKKILLSCQGYVNTDLGEEIGCEAKIFQIIIIKKNKQKTQLFHCMNYYKAGNDKTISCSDAVMVSALVISASISEMQKSILRTQEKWLTKLTSCWP